MNRSMKCVWLWTRGGSWQVVSPRTEWIRWASGRDEGEEVKNVKWKLGLMNWVSFPFPSRVACSQCQWGLFGYSGLKDSYQYLKTIPPVSLLSLWAGEMKYRQTVGVFRIISVKDIRELLMLVGKKIKKKKKTRLISQLKYHSCWYNLPSAALALASNSRLSASISYLILKKMDWHLVHSAFQQYDICIFILTWPDLRDTRLLLRRCR